VEFLNFAGNSGLFQIFSRLPEDEFYRGARVFKAVVAPGAPLKNKQQFLKKEKSGLP
jgi:hypothetical protein